MAPAAVLLTLFFAAVVHTAPLILSSEKGTTFGQGDNGLPSVNEFLEKKSHVLDEEVADTVGVQCRLMFY